MQLKQHHRQVVDYAIEFRTVTADSGCNSPALIDAFMNGLSEPIKDQLAPLELPQDLNSIISMASRVDDHLWEREKEQRCTTVPPPCRWGPTPTPGPLMTSSSPPATSSAKTVLTQEMQEPMQLERTKISPKERHRLWEGCCFYCGQPGHQLPAWEKAELTSHEEGTGERICLCISSLNTNPGS